MHMDGDASRVKQKNWQEAGKASIMDLNNVLTGNWEAVYKGKYSLLHRKPHWEQDIMETNELPYNGASYMHSMQNHENR